MMSEKDRGNAANCVHTSLNMAAVGLELEWRREVMEPDITRARPVFAGFANPGLLTTSYCGGDGAADNSGKQKNGK